MGFQSPAQDYIEKGIDLNELLIHRPSSTYIFEDGPMRYICDASVKPNPGDTIAFRLYGESQIGRYFPKYIVTPEGETYEGEAMNDMEVIGTITFEVMQTWAPDAPV